MKCSFDEGAPGGAIPPRGASRIRRIFAGVLPWLIEAGLVLWLIAAARTGWQAALESAAGDTAQSLTGWQLFLFSSIPALLLAAFALLEAWTGTGRELARSRSQPPEPPFCHRD